MAHAVPLTSASGGVSFNETGEVCLGRTCLQWRADGELSDSDAALVLARLRAVDPALAALTAGGTLRSASV